MENFDRENIDKLLEIRQYFPPSKFCAIQYVCVYYCLVLYNIILTNDYL